MSEPSEPPAARRVLPWEWLALGGVALLFVAVRLPLLRGDGPLLGWNSDAAIFGLMAGAMRRGRELPLFFWGQSYMGPLTSYLGLAISLVRGGVDPLTIRLAAMLEVLGGIVFSWLTLRMLFDRAVAVTVAVWLALGPAFFFHFTIAPIGAEQAFFLGSLILWFASRCLVRGGFRFRDWLVFGVLAGIGWWINQSVVFVIAAPPVAVVLASPFWRDLRAADVEPMPRTTRVLATILYAFLGLDLLLGLLSELGLRLPALFLFDPVLEPALALAVLHVAVFVGRSARRKRVVAEALRSPRGWLLPLAAFVAGALAGYAPVLVGGWLHAFPESYGLSVPAMPLASLPSHLAFIARSDFWQLLGAEPTPAGLICALCIAGPLLAALACRREALRDLLLLRWRPYGPRAVCAVVILLCFLFYAGSQRAHPGSMRYIVCALPLLYGFAADQLRQLRGSMALPLVATAVTLIFLSGRMAQSWEVAAARAEAYDTFPGAFDPRPVMA
ncbi:MAG: hypothetical protein JWN02_2697, partial [Acidobacteria bacterium]|nr:hypothetical protein [Acidobacteriota bacterium]